MKFRPRGARWAVLLSAIVVVSVVAALTATATPAKKQASYVIGVSNTLVGNGWREEMICSVKAQALASGKVSSVKVANRNGGPAEQNADLRNLISAGANAIVVNPSSPNALNAVIAQAASRGVKVVSVDQRVTAPQAHNATNDQVAYGRLGATWLFKQLGGKIDKMIWVPSDAVDMSSYVSSIPSSTQAVWVVLSGSQAASFVNTYASFGLKKKIPLMGITTLTDQAALPAEKPSAAAGIITDSQYCDANPSAVNQQFANAYHAAYGVYPSYYSEAGYTKAQILIAALKSLHGNATNPEAVRETPPSCEGAREMA